MSEVPFPPKKEDEESKDSDDVETNESNDPEVNEADLGIESDDQSNKPAAGLRTANEREKRRKRGEKKRKKIAQKLPEQPSLHELNQQMLESDAKLKHDKTVEQVEKAKALIDKFDEQESDED